MYPVSRALDRLLMLRIEQDWYPTLAKAANGTEKEKISALKQLKEETVGDCTNFSTDALF